MNQVARANESASETLRGIFKSFEIKPLAAIL